MADKDNKQGPFAKVPQKHAGRAKDRILQNLGKANRTTDVDFDVCVKNVCKLQGAATKQQKEFKNYYQCLRALQASRKCLMDTVNELYEPCCFDVDYFCKKSEVLNQNLEDFCENLKNQLLTPVASYMSQFPELNNKIAKRNRKLLDYDNCRHNLQNIETVKKRKEAKIAKAKKQLEEARNLFESINSELHDKIPALYESRVSFFVSNLQCLYLAEAHFHNQDATIFRELYSLLEAVAETNNKATNEKSKISIGFQDDKDKHDPEKPSSQTSIGSIGVLNSGKQSLPTRAAERAKHLLRKLLEEADEAEHLVRKVWEGACKILQNLGKADGTTDVDFDVCVKNVCKLQGAATKLQKEFKNCYQCLRDLPAPHVFLDDTSISDAHFACTPENVFEDSELSSDDDDLTKDIVDMSLPTRAAERAKHLLRKLLEEADEAEHLVRKVWEGACKILQNLGKADGTTDVDFDVCVKNVCKLQGAATKLQKEFKNYYQCLRALQASRKCLMDTVTELYEPCWGDVDNFCTKSEVLNQNLEDFCENLKNQLLTPVASYMSQFPELNNKIAKRNRKLLDYDNCRHNLQNIETVKKRKEAKIAKAKEQLEEARNLFEVINSELHDEIPALYESRVSFFVSNLQCLYLAEAHFHNQDATIFRELNSLLEAVAETNNKAANEKSKISIGQFLGAKINSSHIYKERCTSEVENKQETCRENIALEKISLDRCRNYRKKLNNFVCSVFTNDDGNKQVSLEIFRKSEEQEILSSALFISHDSKEIIKFKPKIITMVSDKPPSLNLKTKENKDEVEYFSLENLPEKYWQRYQVAKLFVDTVKAQTPKVILYKEFGKCIMMENSPNPDFEMRFYDGCKITERRGKINIEDENFSKEGSDYNLLNNFTQYLQMKNACRVAEQAGETLGIFPVVMGRPIVKLINQDTNKENSSPRTMQSSLMSSGSDEEHSLIEELITDGNAAGDTAGSECFRYLYKVQGTYKYNAEDIDELSFDVGDIIDVIFSFHDDPEEQEEGWLLGEFNGKKGWFPANFTSRI